MCDRFCVLLVEGNFHRRGQFGFAFRGRRTKMNRADTFVELNSKTNRQPRMVSNRYVAELGIYSYQS